VPIFQINKTNTMKNNIMTTAVLIAAMLQAAPQLSAQKVPPPRISDPLMGQFVLVAGGSYYRGNTAGADNEKPVHLVTLSPYYVAETEVTQAQWKKVMGTLPSEKHTCAECPVGQVTWNDAQAFIRKLNSQNRKVQYRLPTEAEWEYAARDMSIRDLYPYAGSASIDAVAWYVGNAQNKLQPVKTKQPNALGLYDMSGSVYEWCSDWYGPYEEKAVRNPKGPKKGTLKVTRGGGFMDAPEACRYTARVAEPVDFKYAYSGLRLVRDK